MTIYCAKAHPVPAQQGIGSIFPFQSLDFVSRLCHFHQSPKQGWTVAGKLITRNFHPWHAPCDYHVSLELLEVRPRFCDLKWVGELCMWAIDVHSCEPQSLMHSSTPTHSTTTSKYQSPDGHSKSDGKSQDRKWARLSDHGICNGDHGVLRSGFPLLL